MPDENGFATADDFAAAARSRAYGPPEPLTLPKLGLKVLVRRPTNAALALARMESLPGGEMIAKPEGPEVRFAPEMQQERDERFLRATLAWARVFREMFVSPKISANPKPGELDPNLIDDDDMLFLINWANGHDPAGPGGTGRPAIFPGGLDSGAGNGSGEVRVPPERVDLAGD